MPFETQHKIFKRLAEIADSKSMTKEEQEKYDNSMMVMWDNYAVYKHVMEKEAKKVSKEIALNLLTRVSSSVFQFLVSSNFRNTII